MAFLFSPESNNVVQVYLAAVEINHLLNLLLTMIPSALNLTYTLEEETFPS